MAIWVFVSLFVLAVFIVSFVFVLAYFIMDIYRRFHKRFKNPLEDILSILIVIYFASLLILIVSAFEINYLHDPLNASTTNTIYDQFASFINWIVDNLVPIVGSSIVIGIIVASFSAGRAWNRVSNVLKQFEPDNPESIPKRLEKMGNSLTKIESKVDRTKEDIDKLDGEYNEHIRIHHSK
ncbi:hypothetical protein M1329_00520 [Candidatus Marsarchaeota archaeon]|nr:hypothetical protein [Candidatus Marsarchaeota archaeon]MCL5099642.1 hypothetical protein [Candidatus Marsarchaeota archaeon]